MVSIHPSCVLDSKPPWCLFQDFVLTSKNYIRTVTVCKLEDLLEIAPHYYELGIYNTYNIYIFIQYFYNYIYT